MSKNKFHTITILKDATDITNYCSIDQLTVSSKNLDHSQIYPKCTLKIQNSISDAINIKANDLITVNVEDNREYFRAKEVDYKSDHTQVKLASIFEQLKEKRFLDFDGIIYTPNTLLSSFVNESNLIINPNFETLIKMILTLAFEDDITLVYDYLVKSFDLTTRIETAIDSLTYFSGISISNNIIQWADENEVKPYELLENLQKIFCFNLFCSSTTGDFIFRGLPLFVNNADTAVPINKYLDPDFYNINSIRPKLNPLIGLDKAYYSDQPFYITERKKGLKITDTADTLIKDFDYRNDLEKEEIRLPENLDLSKIPTTLKFSKMGTAYTLKAGDYPAYYRYFSYIDIVQDPDPDIKLNYFRPEGYKKTEYLFTNETGEDKFKDFDNCRECTFNNKDFTVSLIVNKPLQADNLRS